MCQTMRTRIQNRIPTYSTIVCVGAIIFFFGSCQREIRVPIDRNAARSLSDALANDLINDRRDSVRRRLEGSFREETTEAQVEFILSRMFDTYGKPTEVEFKLDEEGIKSYAFGKSKSLRKFWYAVRTTKHEKGEYFLVVEVVPEGDSLGVASFSIVGFSDGVPRMLR